jgi:hypothetical protein
VKRLNHRSLLGRKIVGVSSDGECVHLKLDDGTDVAVMSDAEGNGPGALHLNAPRREFGIVTAPGIEREIRETLDGHRGAIAKLATLPATMPWGKQ